MRTVHDTDCIGIVHPSAKAENLEESAKDMISTYKPDTVTLMGGTNNLSCGERPRALISKIEHLVRKCRQANASTKIVVSGLISRLDRPDLNNSITTINAVLKRNASNKDYAFMDNSNIYNLRTSEKRRTTSERFRNITISQQHQQTCVIKYPFSQWSPENSSRRAPYQKLCTSSERQLKCENQLPISREVTNFCDSAEIVSIDPSDIENISPALTICPSIDRNNHHRVSDILETKDLSVSCHNINRLYLKMDEIRYYLKVYFPVDIYDVVETFLDENVNDSEIAINNYNVVRKDRV